MDKLSPDEPTSPHDVLTLIGAKWTAFKPGGLKALRNEGLEGPQ